MIGSTKAGVHSSVPGTDRRSWDAGEESRSETRSGPIVQDFCLITCGFRADDGERCGCGCEGPSR